MGNRGERMTHLRRALLFLLTPVLRRVADRAYRAHERRADGLRAILGAAQPGDVIVVTRNRSLTSLLIPGHWTHAVLVSGDDWFIHATYPKVVYGRLTEMVLANTDVALLRPKFADAEQQAWAVATAETWLGKPYDLGFDSSVDSFYCSELVWRAYLTAVPKWKFNARFRLGEQTVTPTDLYDADEQFERIVELRGGEVHS